MTNRGETITMLDDQGLPHDFTLIDVVEIDERRYAVLQPEDREAGAVLFRLAGEMMEPVEDRGEFDRVVDVLRDREEYDDLIVEDAGDDRDTDEDDDDNDDTDAADLLDDHDDDEDEEEPDEEEPDEEEPDEEDPGEDGDAGDEDDDDDGDNEEDDDW